MSFLINWPFYNHSLVRRGEILFAYDFLDIWDNDLARMNENKNGKKYQFPDSFILVIGYIIVYFHLPYRQTEGIIKATGKSLPDHPSYSQICRRVNKLDIATKRSSDDDDVWLEIQFYKDAKHVEEVMKAMEGDKMANELYKEVMELITPGPIVFGDFSS